MLKALFASLWDRVIVHYKPTLIGLGVAAAAFVVEYLGTYLAGLPEGWAKIVAPIAVAVGAWLRSKSKTYPQPVP